jgi:hypothetical protein
MNDQDESAIEQEWMAEAERRYAEWKAGRSQSEPAEKVFAELRAKYDADRPV